MKSAARTIRGFNRRPADTRGTSNIGLIQELHKAFDSNRPQSSPDQRKKQPNPHTSARSMLALSLEGMGGAVRKRNRGDVDSAPLICRSR